MKYNILNPKPMNGTPGNYSLPVEQTQDFWLNIWENKMSKMLEFHQIPQNKRQSLLEAIRTYLKPYQQSPSCIPLEETTKFLRNANQENQAITAESLLFFYEKVKASPAHSCQIKDFINEKAALNKWLEKAKLELNASRYSRRTKTNYLTAIHKLLNYTQKPVEEISSDDIKEFLVQLHQKKNLAAITVNNFNSGIRFFLTKVLASDIPMAEIPMMRKNKSLPEVFSQKEIERILAIINNLKHKSLLMCAYGGGLRLSEVVALKRKHIDFEREQIWVRSGKGRKDRCVMLNGALKQVLHIYAENFDLESYLFPSQQRKGQPITTRTAQAVLEQACEKANITGKRNMHKLRHSFATHLLENGVELPHIQALLGHSKIQTTMIYTHVSNATVRKIQSPLNFLNLGNNQTA